MGINLKQLNIAIKRIKLAIKNKESIIVYSDYNFKSGFIDFNAYNYQTIRINSYINLLQNLK